MKFKYDKKTMLFVAGAFFEIVTILGYHGLSYLTNQLGILHVLTVIFAGLYDFLESIWLIGSVALVAYLVYLLKNESSEVDMATVFTVSSGCVVTCSFCRKPSSNCCLLTTSLSHDCPCALVSMRTSVSPT